MPSTPALKTSLPAKSLTSKPWRRTSSATSVQPGCREPQCDTPLTLESLGGVTTARPPEAQSFSPSTGRPEAFSTTSSTYEPGSSRIVSSASAASAAAWKVLEGVATRTARYWLPDSRLAALPWAQTRQLSASVTVLPQASSAATWASVQTLPTLLRSLASAFAKAVSTLCSWLLRMATGARQWTSELGPPQVLLRWFRHC